MRSSLSWFLHESKGRNILDRYGCGGNKWDNPFLAAAGAILPVTTTRRSSKQRCLVTYSDNNGDGRYVGTWERTSCLVGNGLQSLPVSSAERIFWRAIDRFETPLTSYAQFHLCFPRLGGVRGSRSQSYPTLPELLVRKSPSIDMTNELIVFSALNWSALYFY